MRTARPANSREHSVQAKDHDALLPLALELLVYTGQDIDLYDESDNVYATLRLEWRP